MKNNTPTDWPSEFRTRAVKLVARASVDGVLPGRSNLPLVWENLTDDEQRDIKKWIDNRLTSAVLRLDARSAHAFANLRNRVIIYSKGH